MPTTIPTTTSTTRPGSPSTGDAYFETDTNNYIIYDGANWRGYANDGITFGGNSYVAQLDGTDDYLTLGDVSGTLGGATKCTVSWWMKKPNTSNIQARWMMGEGLDNLFFLWDNANTRMFFGIGNGSGSYAQAVTSAITSILDNTWYLWTFIYDGTQSTENDRVQLYKNTTSISVSRTASTTIPTSLNSTTGDDPNIGAYYSSGSYQFFSDASYDDFAIFDDALTSTQVANIYNNQIYPSSSLKHLFRMENNVNDSVGSANGSVPNQVTWQTSNLPY
jgi:hypothetical protein